MIKNLSHAHLKMAQITPSSTQMVAPYEPVTKAGYASLPHNSLI